MPSLAEPTPHELPKVQRCAHCFAVCNPDGTCPGEGNHVYTARAGAVRTAEARHDEELPRFKYSEAEARIQRVGLGIYSDNELALAINTTPNTLMSWRANGQGPVYVKLGKRVFYRLEAVLEWIKRCEKHDVGV